MVEESHATQGYKTYCAMIHLGKSLFATGYLMGDKFRDYIEKKSLQGGLTPTEDNAAQASIVNAIFKDYNLQGKQREWIYELTPSLLQEISADQIWPKAKEILQEDLAWARKKLSAVEPKRAEDATIALAVEAIKDYLELFVRSRAPAQRVSYLEDIHFYLQLEFEPKTDKTQLSKANYALKCAVTNFANLFDLFIVFRDTNDFISESNYPFVSAEFLNDFEIVLNTIVN